MKTHTPRPRGGLSVALALAMLPALQAAPLLYEGFDYATGTEVTGMRGGYGWNGSWQTVNNGSAVLTEASLTAGASSPSGYDGLSTGNAIDLPNARRVGRRVDTSANGLAGQAGLIDASNRIGADGTTVYVSFLQKPNGTSSYYEFEFHRGSLGDGGRIGGIGNDQGGDNVHLRAPNGTHTLIGPGNTDVNFYVVRIDYKAGNDDVRVYRNPTGSTEPPTATLTANSVADMSFDGISFGAFVGDRTVMHDEVRMGSTWQDVTVPAASTPAFLIEPQAAVTGYESESISLSAVAAGQPLPSYQWNKNGTPLPGETGETLLLDNLSSADAGNYTVTITNTEGFATSSGTAVSVAAPPAGLLAYEGFDYPAGTGTLPLGAGGLGWAGSWQQVNGGGGNVLAGSLLADSNAPNGYDAESTGNSSQLPNAQRDGRLLDTSPGGRFDLAGYLDGNGNIGADGTTLYISFLQQPSGTSKFYEFEFHRDDLGDPGRVGGVGNDTANPTVALRTGGLQNVIGAGSTGVNFYVVRIDFQPGNDDVSVYQNPLSSAEPVDPTFFIGGASDMSFDGISLAAFDNGRTVRHDEIRLGQSWSDVVFGTSRRNLTWVGNGVSNNWDFTSANWSDGSSATQFVNGDPVGFDDNGSATPAINVTDDVSTATLVFDNDSKDYTLGGSGSVTSSSGLEKSGQGSLALNLPVTLGGSIVINDGDFQLGDSAVVGGDLTLDNFEGTTTLSGASEFSGSLLANESSVALSGSNSFAGIVTSFADVTLTGDTTITGGAVVWFGNTPGTSTLTIEEGSSLTATSTMNDAMVFGRDGGSATVVQNGGTITYDPPNQDWAFIGASLPSDLTVAGYTLNGGLIDMPAKRLGLAIGPITANLDQSGGTINARNLSLGSIGGGGTGEYRLTGGRLNLGADGITSDSGNYLIELGGGTVGALADWATALDFTLTGTNGDVVFDTNGQTISLNGIIGGTVGLVKEGEGALNFTALNSFSGATQVNAGTVGGFGNSDNSAITLAPGTTLAPGIDGIGEFYTASASFGAGSELAIEIDSSFVEADQLVPLGNATIAGATLTLSDRGAGLIPAGTELVIIDYSQGGSLTGTFTGLPEGSAVTVGSNSFTLNYANDSKVTLTSTTVLGPFDTWASDAGLDGTPGRVAGFGDDPEGDGLPNGLEYILGGDPLANDGGSLIAVAANETTGLQLDFKRADSSVGVASLIVEYTTDLSAETWNEVPIGATGSTVNGVVVGIDTTTDPDSVTVTIPASKAPGGKLFARLRATLP